MERFAFGLCTLVHSNSHDHAHNWIASIRSHVDNITYHLNVHTMHPMQAGAGACACACHDGTS